MKKEALMALLADLPDGSEIRIPAPVLARRSDKEKSTTSAALPWQDRVLNDVARLIPALVSPALMLIIIGFTILGARWMASGSNMDQTGKWGVIADHQKQRPMPVGRLV